MATKKDAPENIEEPKNPICGIIMPLSSIDGCGVEHWLDVKKIIIDSINQITSPKFETKLVCDSDEVSVIQKTIVQNVYYSEIVVCDVSGKNPNVMFELGMRLAFDKPTVIIIDDNTEYSFDTGIIEHIKYPRDLRHGTIDVFKKNLSNKVLSTYQKYMDDKNYSSFLKNFGQFIVQKLGETDISADKYLIEMVKDLQTNFSSLQRSIARQSSSPIRTDSEEYNSLEGKFSSARTFKGRSQVRNSILKYIEKNPDIEISSMIDNAELFRFVEMNFIENNIIPAQYFKTHISFENCVDSVVRSLINLS